MFPLVDLIATVGGLIIPPAFDFIKKLFVDEKEDTPERTIGNLATTKPDVVAPYVESLGKYYLALKDYFNRDVSGPTSVWVNNIRALIRPVVTCLAVIALIGDGTSYLTLADGARLTCEATITSWMGSRFTIR